MRKKAGLRAKHGTLCSISHHSTTWWSDRKRVRKEAGLRAKHGTLCATSHHSTTWWSDRKPVRKEAGLRAKHGTLCSTSHHSTTWWSDRKPVRKEAGLRAKHGTLYSTSHHSTTWWSDRKRVRKEAGLRALAPHVEEPGAVETMVLSLYTFCTNNSNIKEDATLVHGGLYPLCICFHVQGDMQATMETDSNNNDKKTHPGRHFYKICNFRFIQIS